MWNNGEVASIGRNENEPYLTYFEKCCISFGSNRKQPDRTTMKKLILLIGILLLTGNAIAQSNQISIGADMAFPSGDFAESFGFGLGPTVGLELPFGNRLGIIGQASYQVLFSNNDLIDRGRMIPLQAGAKIYLRENQRGFYVKGLAGVHSNSTRTNAIGPIPGASATSSTFSWALGFGIQFERLDIGGRFNSITADPDVPGDTSSSRYFGLRVGYIVLR
jgi:hypothetical protein